MPGICRNLGYSAHVVSSKDTCGYRVVTVVEIGLLEFDPQAPRYNRAVYEKGDLEVHWHAYA